MKIVECGDIVLIPTGRKYTVHVGDRSVSLRPTCGRVFQYLIEREGCIVPKECLYRDVWTAPRPEPKIVDIYVCLLRRHLGNIHPSMSYHIQTVFGIGYRFVQNLTLPEKTPKGHRPKGPHGKRDVGMVDRMYDLYFENREA